ncbi:TPA: DUF2627 domain-containing protein [Escherichia coli]
MGCLEIQGASLVEYRFSAEPYIGASCSNVSVLSMLCLRAKKTI